MATAIQETLDLVGDALPASISRVVTPFSGGCIAEIDRSGFAQVLTNLVLNACNAVESTRAPGACASSSAQFSR